MFYKEEFSFELGTFASNVNWHRHILEEQLTQLPRFQHAEHGDVRGVLSYTPDNLSYLWALNLELGVETMAIYHKDFKTPIVVVDRPTPWKDQPHHAHMAKFVDHHVGQKPDVRRTAAAEFIIRMLNELSVKALRAEIRELDTKSTTEIAKRALRTVDSGK